MKLIEAYKLGNKLDNSTEWKQVQLVVTCIAVVLDILGLFGVDINLTTEEISSYAWAIFCVVNAYLIVATTDKLGIGNKRQKMKMPFMLKPTDYPKDYDEHDNN